MVVMVVGLQDSNFLLAALHEIGRQRDNPRPCINHQPLPSGKARRLNTETSGVAAILDLACACDRAAAARSVKCDFHNSLSALAYVCLDAWSCQSCEPALPEA